MTGLPPVLVLDGEQRAALAIARSLGRSGFPVHVGSHQRKPIAGGCRHVTSEVQLPEPLSEPSAYAAAVAESVAATGAYLAIPVTDPSILALRENLEPGQVRIPCGNLASYRQASDKKFVLHTAQRIGIAVPAQFEIEEAGARIPDLDRSHFPVVLKPARSVTQPASGRTKVGVTYADDTASLRTALDRYHASAFPILLQHRITGAGMGVFLLRWNGVINACFAHRRLTEFPPSGGVSVCCESVELPQELGAKAQSLLECLDWEGVAMVEFKIDRNDGTPYLMEVNPRFWGSLQLAIDAGVDFPLRLVKLALGQPLPPLNTWRVGIRSRWEWGEIDHLIARLTKSRQRLDLPRDAPSLLHAVVEAAIPWRPGQRNAVFRLRDPMPFVRESLAWFRALRGST